VLALCVPTIEALEVFVAIIGVVFGILLLAVAVAGLVSAIVILVEAFKTSITDGLLSLFIPFYIGNRRHCAGSRRSRRQRRRRRANRSSDSMHATSGRHCLSVSIGTR